MPEKFLSPEEVKAKLKEDREKMKAAQSRLSGDQQSFNRSLYRVKTNAHAPLGLIALMGAIRKRAVLSEHEPVLAILRTYTPSLLNYWLQQPM